MLGLDATVRRLMGRVHQEKYLCCLGDFHFQYRYTLKHFFEIGEVRAVPCIF